MFSGSTRSINLVLTVVFCLVCIGILLGIMIHRNQNISNENVPERILSTSYQTETPTLYSTLPALFSTQTSSIAPTETNLGFLPLSQDQRGLITNGDRTVKKIALTFDVCQAEGELSGYDTGIVKTLTETQTPATFFLGGEWIRDHEENAKELASNPLFELGNHSWSHADFSSIDSQKMEQEINLAQERLYNLTGRQNKLFRLPYGYYNDEALKVIGDSGLYTIQWDVVSGDPDPNIYAPAMTDWVLQQVQPGSIIIMHANGRGWHTAEALPTIIQTLRELGYTFVTIPELLNIPKQ